MNRDKQVYHLWKLLDDIDTLDDAVKSNDRAFREHVRRIQRKRFEIVDEATVDALYKLYYTDSNSEEKD